MAAITTQKIASPTAASTLNDASRSVGTAIASVVAGSSTKSAAWLTIAAPRPTCAPRDRASQAASALLAIDSAMHSRNSSWRVVMVSGSPTPGGLAGYLRNGKSAVDQNATAAPPRQIDVAHEPQPMPRAAGAHRLAEQDITGAAE